MDSMWAEGRRGHWVIRSLLEHNDLAGKVMCSTRDSWRVTSGLPNVQLLTEHVQMDHKVKACGPLLGRVWGRV